VGYAKAYSAWLTILRTLDNGFRIKFSAAKPVHRHPQHQDRAMEVLLWMIFLIHYISFAMGACSWNSTDAWVSHMRWLTILGLPYRDYGQYNNQHVLHSCLPNLLGLSVHNDGHSNSSGWFLNLHCASRQFLIRSAIPEHAFCVLVLTPHIEYSSGFSSNYHCNGLY